MPPTRPSRMLGPCLPSPPLRSSAPRCGLRSRSSSTAAPAGSAGPTRRSTASSPLLREHGAAARGMVTHDLGELRDAARAALGGRLVLVGGDGGVHALANLGPTLPELALIPAGQANNIARALGIPTDLAARRGARRQRRRRGRSTRCASRRRERTLVAVEGVSAGFHAAARHRYTRRELRRARRRRRRLRARARPLRAATTHEVVVDGAPLSDGDRRAGLRLEPPLLRLRLPRRPDRARRRRPARGDRAARADAAPASCGSSPPPSAARHLDRRGVTWSHGEAVAPAEPLPLVADAEPLGVTTARDQRAAVAGCGSSRPWRPARERARPAPPAAPTASPPASRCSSRSPPSPSASAPRAR